MDLSIAKAIIVKGAGNRGKTTLIFEFIILGGILPWLARRLPLSSRK